MRIACIIIGIICYVMGVVGAALIVKGAASWLVLAAGIALGTILLALAKLIGKDSK